jgi:hypothetical protein
MISSLASANEPNAIITNSLIQDMITRTLNPTDLINWKVGDTATYNVTLAGLPFGGSMVKSVTKDDGATLELTEDVDLTIQKQNVVAVINKADGKIVKMTVNGQDQAVPDDKVEVISQDVTEIDVPAGHFKCIHIVAKTAQVSKLEEWANPSATVMDGSLKVIENGQTTVTMELKSFAHGS